MDGGDHQEAGCDPGGVQVKKKWKETPSLTKYVVFSIALLLIYSVAEFVFAVTTGQSHDTLTTCVFACFGGEILSCALIKIFKLKGDNAANG